MLSLGGLLAMQDRRYGLFPPIEPERPRIKPPEDPILASANAKYAKAAEENELERIRLAQERRERRSQCKSGN